MLLIGDDVFGESDGADDVPIRVTFESVRGQRGNFIDDVGDDRNAAESHERRTIEEQLVVPRRGEAHGNGGHRLTTVDFKTVFDREEMTALGNGALRMRVASVASPERAVVGFLAPRFSCDLFDTVLAAEDGDDDEDDEAAEDNVGDVSGNSLDGQESEDVQEDVDEEGHNASGMAWMFMKKDGEIEYHVRWVQFSTS